MVRRPRLAASLSVGLIAFVAGSLTLLPGVAFWDTAELQAVGPLMGTAHPTGFPTYVLVGWLASVVLQPFGEPAFLMNLLSTICVAVAAGVTVDLVRRLTGGWRSGWRPGSGSRSCRPPGRWPRTPRRTRSTWRSWRSSCGCWSPGRTGSAAARDRAAPTAVTATSSRRPRSSGWLSATTR